MPSGSILRHKKVSQRLKAVYAEGELSATATIRKFRIVHREGNRNVQSDMAQTLERAVKALPRPPKDKP